ncbi:hypothetical protein RUM43_008994, partial [Polyplax serrata]
MGNASFGDVQLTYQTAGKSTSVSGHRCLAYGQVKTIRPRRRRRRCKGDVEESPR